MLYSMARRYDEWAEEDENEDSGSSLRGALKGWAKHGASSERLWTTLPMPPAQNEPADDWWLDAVKRPLGAYYRISPENVRDMHVALKEVGAVYASALTHEGWDACYAKRKADAEGSRSRCPSSRRRAATPTKATRSRSSATRAKGSSSTTRGARVGARRLRRAAVRGLAAATRWTAGSCSSAS